MEKEPIITPTPPDPPLVPSELIRSILIHLDDVTLATCLRVSKAMFHIAGSVLYAEITIKGDKWGRGGVLYGAEVTAKPLTQDGFSKRVLLDYTRSIRLEEHYCGQRNQRILDHPPLDHLICKHHPYNIAWPCNRRHRCRFVLDLQAREVFVSLRSPSWEGAIVSAEHVTLVMPSENCRNDQVRYYPQSWSKQKWALLNQDTGSQDAKTSRVVLPTVLFTSFPPKGKQYSTPPKFADYGDSLSTWLRHVSR